jgi:hypothetical protein
MQNLLGSTYEVDLAGRLVVVFVMIDGYSQTFLGMSKYISVVGNSQSVDTTMPLLSFNSKTSGGTGGTCEHTESP